MQDYGLMQSPTSFSIYAYIVQECEVHQDSSGVKQKRWANYKEILADNDRGGVRNLCSLTFPLACLNNKQIDYWPKSIKSDVCLVGEVLAELELELEVEVEDEMKRWNWASIC